MVSRSAGFLSNVPTSQTSLIRTPVIRAPPQPIIMLILQKLWAVQWVWPIVAHTFILYSEIRTTPSYGHPLIPRRPDKRGFTVYHCPCGMISHCNLESWVRAFLFAKTNCMAMGKSYSQISKCLPPSLIPSSLHSLPPSLHPAPSLPPSLTKTFFNLMSLCNSAWLCRNLIPSTTSTAICILVPKSRPCLRAACRSLG